MSAPAGWLDQIQMHRVTGYHPAQTAEPTQPTQETADARTGKRHGTAPTTTLFVRGAVLIDAA